MAMRVYAPRRRQDLLTRTSTLQSVTVVGVVAARRVPEVAHALGRHEGLRGCIVNGWSARAKESSV